MSLSVQAPLVVGLDLGTSNCALSWARPEEGATVVDFQIHQLLRPGQSGALPLLPSCLYLPSPHEFTGAGEASAPVAGEFARWQGARVPGRLVSSAKSWLCHPGVDRSAAILPWGAPPEVARLSPVDASSALLGHLARAWDAAFPGAPLAEQDLVITVPASFDEVARTLTAEAARRQGLAHFHFIEEPQAAFYDFVRQQGGGLRASLAGVRLVLVIDVGGGTTDLTLIQVAEDPEGGEPLLRRVAVGEHLMLGGDNMDATLARLAEERLTRGARRLGPVQWAQLVQACRAAKEALLAPDAPECHGIAIAGEGSRLLGNTLSCELARDELRSLLLDGFLPACAAGEGPRRGQRSGLQELGLPYAQDAAITRHVSGFLLQHAAAARAALEAGGTSPGPLHPTGPSSPFATAGATGSGAPGTAAVGPVPLPRPDAILLNGGVFNSPLLRERLLSVLASWWPGQPAPRLLGHSSLDLAVARGAVAHGLARRGLGRRISGGAAHSLYVGLGPDPRDGLERALCVVSRGDEEGCRHELRSVPLELTLGRPVRFPLYAAADDRADAVGSLVVAGSGLVPVSPLSTVLRSGTQSAAVLPVHLRSSLSELGTLELDCVSEEETPQTWRLEFDLRASQLHEAADALPSSSPPPASLPSCPTTSPRSPSSASPGAFAVPASPIEPPAPVSSPVPVSQAFTGFPAVPEAPGARQDSAASVKRGGGAAPGQCPGVGLDPRALRVLEAAFGDKPQVLSPKDLRQLTRSLEESCGPREEWSLDFLRTHWAWLSRQAATRRRSADHERSWLQLYGFFLRPGFGDNADSWRCEQALALLGEGVKFSGDPAVWSEHWVLFRRVSGGLNEAAQLSLWETLKPHLSRRAPLRPAKHLPRPKGVQPEGLEEMVRLAASLEHLPVSEKELLGSWLLERLEAPGQVPGPWAWALGRLAGRVPLYGSAHRVVPPSLAATWLECLLRRGLSQEGAPFAAAQISRLSGDRARDLEESLRERSAALLAAARVPERWIQMLREVVVLDAAESARALGDRLPHGLRLRFAP